MKYLAALIVLLIDMATLGHLHGKIEGLALSIASVVALPLPFAVIRWWPKKP